jgi:hypothetical protein
MTACARALAGELAKCAVDNGQGWGFGIHELGLETSAD